jgi:predicted outer membrane lipoprotein
MTALDVSRDDGPLARALGRSLGPAVPLPPALVLAAGVLGLLVVIAVAGDGASTLAAALAVGWLVLAGGASARPARERMRWTGPPLVRLGEYAALIWLAALAGPSALPAAFAVLAALAYRHYDLTYRLRHRGATPARWVNLLSGGWDGRVVAAVALLALGAVTPGYYVAAVLLGIAFVGESAAGWMTGVRARPAGFDDEEDDGL